jgi:hypothetical protein
MPHSSENGTRVEKQMPKEQEQKKERNEEKKMGVMVL